MRKIGFKYPIKIQMSVRVTHNLSAATSVFLFLFVSLITFNDRKGRTSVSALPGFTIEKA